MREERIRHNGWKDVGSSPLGVMAMAALMALYPSTAEDRTTKKRSTQNLG